VTGENLLLAHCVWVDSESLDILEKTGTKVSHCPSTNLKLASGIAPVTEMQKRGICVSLGADGAAANNNLNAFVEMRHAALLPKGTLFDPTALSARQVFEMATINGAKALGLQHEIGTIEVGKKADIVILNLNKPNTIPHTNLFSTIVYAAGPENVETVIVDGKVILQQNQFVQFDEMEKLNMCTKQSERLLQRAQIHL